MIHVSPLFAFFIDFFSGAMTLLAFARYTSAVKWPLTLCVSAVIAHFGLLFGIASSDIYDYTLTICVLWFSFCLCDWLFQRWAGDEHEQSRQYPLD